MQLVNKYWYPNIAPTSDAQVDSFMQYVKLVCICRFPDLRWRVTYLDLHSITSHPGGQSLGSCSSSMISSLSYLVLLSQVVCVLDSSAHSLESHSPFQEVCSFLPILLSRLLTNWLLAGGKSTHHLNTYGSALSAY
jgi:hypothetical protein